MSYHVETDNQTDHKYIINVKHRRSICSIDGCLLRVQRNCLCAKHLQTCIKTTSRNRVKKQRWSTSPPVRKLSTDNSTTINIDQILSKFQVKIEPNVNNRSTYITHSNPDDTNSENSIEYDYTNPLSISTTTTPHIEQRHVSVATIYLPDEQWHQLELFIKRFSSCVSLSNNLNINSSTTHLLIDDSLTPLRCIFSKKIFQAVARHIFIVSIRWIEECLLQNQIIDETPFEIHGDETMSTMHLARKSPLISLFSSSISFIIDCNSFQRVLTRHDLIELVILTGGTLFDREQNISIKMLLVLVDPTVDRYKLEEKYKQYHKNIKYLTPGFLLKSIIYQKQQPFEDFEL